MKFSFWNYSNAPQSDAVVVLFAGPSVKQNSEKILAWIDKYNAKVFCSNYNYSSVGIRGDFTYIANDFKLKDVAPSIECSIIVPVNIDRGELPSGKAEKILKKCKKRGIKVYLAGTKKHSSTYKIPEGYAKIDKEGRYLHSRLSSAGHGSMLVSLMCKPNRMLIVGCDGPGGKNAAYKKFFDGSKRAYNRPHKHKRFTKHFINVILPTAKKYCSRIETFKNVPLYELDKKKYGITVVD
jgi:hypothetical protein